VDDEMTRTKTALVVIAISMLLFFAEFLPKASATLYYPNPSDDSYVSSGNPSTNYGNLAYMIVGYNPSTLKNRGILKFNITDVGATPTSATLYVYAESWLYHYLSRLWAFSVTDDSWTESGVTWNNKPAAIAQCGDGTPQDIIDTPRWLSWNVTDFVISEYSGDKIVSLYILGTEGPAIYEDAHIISGESTTNKPYLMVNTGAVTSYTITSSSSVGGSIYPSGDVVVPAGGDQMFMIEGDVGYKPTSLLVDGVPVSFTPYSSLVFIQPPIFIWYANYTFEDVDSDHTISVLFEKYFLYVTVSYGLGGTVYPNGTIPVESGTTDFTIICTPDSGYEVTGIYADDRYVGASTTFTYPNPITHNLDIYVTFGLAPISTEEPLDPVIMIGLMVIVGLGAIGFAIGGGKEPMPALFLMLFGCAICYYAGLFPWWIFVLSAVTLALLSAWRFSSIFKGGG
jgi:hypothetical protein